MSESVRETNKLSVTMKENVAETKKIDSHVVRMTKMLELSTTELDKFRSVWRHYVAALRKIAAFLGKLDLVDGDLSRIEVMLDVNPRTEKSSGEKE